MAPERKRKSATPAAVPELGDPDRKRVLNVLAQRRYRQRRKEKIAALEAQAKGLTPPSSVEQTDDDAVEAEIWSPSASASTPASEGTLNVEEMVRESNDMDFPSDLDQGHLEFPMFNEFELSNLPTPLPSIPGSPTFPTRASQSPPPLNFPLTLDMNMTIPILSTLRAASSIAMALNILTKVLDPFSIHVLPPIAHPSLPPNLHPTPAQVAIPHHPLIDTLPWPSVREKLICMFNLPSSLRPPIAREDDGNENGCSKAIMQITYDMDDPRDGLRVHGNATGWDDVNELVEDSWEIGEAFFKNWWWCVDAKVLEVTNRRRRARGLAALRLENRRT